MSYTLQSVADKTTLADAIRAKCGLPSTTKLAIEDMINEVSYIPPYLQNTDGIQVDSNGNCSGYTGSATDVIINVNGQINNKAFANNTNIKSVIIGKKVTVIGQEAFQNCTALEIVIVEAGSAMASVSPRAFQKCTSLHTLLLPDTITNMGSACLQDCRNLSNFKFPDGLTSLDNCLAMSSLVLEPPQGQNIILPDNILTINSHAFNRNTSLASIRLPISLTTFGSMPFNSCHKLKKVFIPPSLTTVPDLSNYDTVFNHCKGLEEIKVHSGNEKFYDTSNHTCLVMRRTEGNIVTDGAVPESGEVVIDYGPTELSFSAWRGKSRLTKITIPASITKIGAQCFRDCTNLTEIVINKSTGSITGQPWTNGSVSGVTVTWIG